VAVKAMKVAIATGQFFKPRETMINRHIMQMFGGETCVICNTLTEDPRPEKDYIALKNVRQSLFDKVFNKPVKIRNAQKYHVRDMPWGRQKRKLLRFLATQKVDAIFCEFGTQTMRLAPIAKELGLPILGYFRGADATSELKKKGRIEAYKTMVPMTGAFISVAQFLLDHMAEHGIEHPESHVIPSGVDVRRFSPGEKIPGRCVAVGRMIEKKAPLMTLRVFCDIAEAHPGASLEMLGGGTFEEECRHYVRMRGMGDRVTIRGESTHDEVLTAMKRAEIFMQHSVVGPDGNTEGLPTAIQEAMACGTAILSTRHAGIPEAVIEGENGFLVDEFDLDSYRAGLSRMLSGEMDIAAIMARSRALAVEKYDNAKLLTLTENLIVEHVERAKRAAAAKAA
jgi:glycosyltransferase involved in cell wall biosynthesis